MSDRREDILASNLRAIFCGINPATSAEASGHNFSSPTNRFWNVLYLAGFTDVRLDARDERRLLDYGLESQLLFAEQLVAGARFH